MKKVHFKYKLDLRLDAQVKYECFWKSEKGKRKRIVIILVFYLGPLIRIIFFVTGVYFMGLQKLKLVLFHLISFLYFFCFLLVLYETRTKGMGQDMMAGQFESLQRIIEISVVELANIFFHFERDKILYECSLLLFHARWSCHEDSSLCLLASYTSLK